MELEWQIITGPESEQPFMICPTAEQEMENDDFFLKGEKILPDKRGRSRPVTCQVHGCKQASQAFSGGVFVKGRVEMAGCLLPDTHVHLGVCCKQQLQ